MTNLELLTDLREHGGYRLIQERQRKALNDTVRRLVGAAIEDVRGLQAQIRLLQSDPLEELIIAEGTQ